MTTCVRRLCVPTSTATNARPACSLCHYIDADGNSIFGSVWTTCPLLPAYRLRFPIRPKLLPSPAHRACLYQYGCHSVRLNGLTYHLPTTFAQRWRAAPVLRRVGAIACFVPHRTTACSLLLSYNDLDGTALYTRTTTTAAAAARPPPHPVSTRLVTPAVHAHAFTLAFHTYRPTFTAPRKSYPAREHGSLTTPHLRHHATQHSHSADSSPHRLLPILPPYPAAGLAHNTTAVAVVYYLPTPNAVRWQPLGPSRLTSTTVSFPIPPMPDRIYRTPPPHLRARTRLYRLPPHLPTFACPVGYCLHRRTPHYRNDALHAQHLRYARRCLRAPHGFRTLLPAPAAWRHYPPWWDEPCHGAPGQQPAAPRPCNSARPTPPITRAPPPQTPFVGWL